MAISIVDYHFQFLQWFSSIHPELGDSYSKNFVLNINKPVITLRTEGIDQSTIKILQSSIAEFTRQFQHGVTGIE